MRLEVGPFEPARAVAWIQWADEMLGELRSKPARAMSVSAEVVDDVRRYLEQLKPEAGSLNDTFRWHGEIEPDRLEYLVHAFFNLDVQLQQGERSGAPDEARDFHLVLVRSLLHALETDCPSRAAFVDQLRWSWPMAVAAD